MRGSCWKWSPVELGEHLLGRETCSAWSGLQMLDASMEAGEAAAEVDRGGAGWVHCRDEEKVVACCNWVAAEIKGAGQSDPVGGDLDREGSRGRHERGGGGYGNGDETASG